MQWKPPWKYNISACLVCSQRVYPPFLLPLPPLPEFQPSTSTIAPSHDPSVSSCLSICHSGTTRTTAPFSPVCAWAGCGLGGGLSCSAQLTPAPRLRHLSDFFKSLFPLPALMSQRSCDNGTSGCSLTPLHPSSTPPFPPCRGLRVTLRCVALAAGTSSSPTDH